MSAIHESQPRIEDLQDQPEVMLPEPAPEQLVLFSDETNQQPDINQASLEVKSFNDKYGHTRFIKKGVNPNTGYKFTSFISKEEASRLGVDDVATLPRSIQDTAVKEQPVPEAKATAPRFAFSDELNAAFRKIDEEDSKGLVEDVALPGESKSQTMDRVVENLTKSAEPYEPKHMKKEEKIRFARLKKIGRNVLVQLGLAPDPNQGEPIQPPNAQESLVDAEEKLQSWIPPRKEEVTNASTPVPTQPVIHAERAGEQKHRAA